MKLTQPSSYLIRVIGPYSQQFGIIGRFFRILWAPIAYILGKDFEL